MDSARRLNLTSSDTVVVGISGGPDSTCLLDVLAKIRGRLGVHFRLHAAHLIHDFRGQEKYDDAQFVREFCERCGHELTVDEVDVAAYQVETGISSFEQAARDLRYEFLGKVATSVGARFVAVAHTADDLAETVLLHIARGSGIHGLRGMEEVGTWPYPGIGEAPQVWRPLLGVRRVDTVGYCQRRGTGYRDDSTNYMEDFARNRVRMNLMPTLAKQLNPRIVGALGRLARTASSQLDFMEARADEHWPAVAPEAVTPEGVLRLRKDSLADLHPASQALILRRAWTMVSGSSKRLAERHLQALQAMARRNISGKTVALPGGYTVRTEGDWLEFRPCGLVNSCPYPEPFGEFRITLPWGPIAVGITKRGGWEVTARSITLQPATSLDTGDAMRVYLSKDALAEGATVRTWRAGDRMQPLGMTGHRKLQDMFTDAGIPRDWRATVPLVTGPRGIMWAAGVRIADWAAVVRRPGESVEAIEVEFRLEKPLGTLGED